MSNPVKSRSDIGGPVDRPGATLAPNPTEHSRAGFCAAEQNDFNRLQADLERLKKENQDLRLALSASQQHRDLLQEHLCRISGNLTEEIRVHQAAEEKLQKVVQGITQEKVDLEILVQILIDQGDESAEDSEKARIDALTQIANRRRFDEYLSQEWDRHARLHQPLSLLMCDVDHFKLYNDHYGHQAGDHCLKTVAQTLQACFRTGDLVARYGGEEFAIVLPHTDVPGAVVACERVRAALRSAHVAHAASLVSDRVTLSIGVACVTPLPKSPGDRHKLIEVADRNLYAAKHAGRDQINTGLEPNESAGLCPAGEENLSPS